MKIRKLHNGTNVEKIYVKSIRRIKLEKPEKVYDASVDEIHNYALDAGVYVHNSAKQARSRMNQAILPLRGKVLNCEKATMTQMLGNNEIETIICSLGVKIGPEFKNLDSLRYHKIILLADADVDGLHICTLLLTFFFRHIPEIILNGHLFIGQPPLYRIRIGKKEVFKYTEKDKEDLLKKIPGNKAKISRFKGLGEMPPELLWNTTMDPNKRKLVQVKITDAVVADQTFDMLMGKDAAPRCQFITENADKVANLDI